MPPIDYLRSIATFLRQHKQHYLPLFLLLALYGTITVPLIDAGPYNPDEGWYLYDAWRAWQGELPYRDFGFPQSPLTLAVHGLFQVLLGPSWYLGRLINTLLGALVVALTYLLSYRLTNQISAMLASLLLAASPWFALHMTNVSTYATSMLVLLLMLFALASRRYVLAGALAIAAVWTRFSLLPLLPALLIGVILFTPGHRQSSLLATLRGYGLGLLLLVLPVLTIAGPDRAWVNIASYHVDAYSNSIEPSATTNTFTAWYEQRQTFLRESYWLRYGLLWLAAALALPFAVVRPFTPRTATVVITAICTVAIAAGHSLSSNATYDVPLLPLLAITAAWGIAAVLQRLPTTATRLILAALIIGFIHRYLLIPQLPLYHGYGEQEAPHLDVQRVARYIREHSQPDDYIFTPELYIALEAGRRVPPGFGIGRFFYAPHLTDDEARRRGMLNAQMLHETIMSQQAKFIVINEAHRWNNRRESDTEQFNQWLHDAHYRPVPALTEHVPVVSMLQVYERTE